MVFLPTSPKPCLGLGSYLNYDCYVAKRITFGTIIYIVRVIFTNHVKERMRERGILVSDIKKSIVFPTARLPSYSPTQKIQKIVKGRTLEIIFEQKSQIIIIITAYYL